VAQLRGRLLVEVLHRECGEPGEEHQLQRVGAAYDVVGDPALLGTEPGHVAGEDRVVDGGEVVAAPSSDLHVTDQELGEVETDRSGAEEPVVDEHEVVAALLCQEVVGAGVPVAGDVGHPGELVGVRRGPVGGIEQALVEVVVERAGDQRVLPEPLVAHGGQHLQRESALEVGVHRHLVADLRAGLHHLRTGGEPTHEPRRLDVAVQVPLEVRDRDRLEPHGVGLLVEVEDPQRPGHREAVGEPVPEVGPVGLRLGPPGDRVGGRFAVLRRDQLEERVP
jgi:hypothetical protein